MTTSPLTRIMLSIVRYRFFSRWQLLAFLLLPVVFAVSTLFYHYSTVLNAQMLDTLKGVYPEIFIELSDNNGHAPEGVDHFAEYFTVSFGGLRFRHTPVSTIKVISDSAIRMFPPQHVPTALEQAPQDVVVVNDIFYRLVAASPQFDGKGIYLERMDRRDEFLYVRIQRQNFLSDKPWAVVPQEVANRLGFFPNIIAVYPKTRMTYKELRVLHARTGETRPLLVWTDRAPFATLAVYKIVNSYYLYLVVAFCLAALSFTILVLSDVLQELYDFIVFAAANGMSRLALVARYVVIVSLYFTSIMVLGHAVAVAGHNSISLGLPPALNVSPPFHWQAVSVALAFIASFTGIAVLFIYGRADRLIHEKL